MPSTASMGIRISAAIITHNEERNIARAIESLRCCDEILVLDSGSTDRTVEIATKLGARVVESSWHGYAAQKNYRGRTGEPRLDSVARRGRKRKRSTRSGNLADQENRPAVRRVHDAATGAISGALDSSQRLVSGPQGPPVRPPQGEVGRANIVHESVVVHGRIGHLESNLLHFTCSSLSEHLRSLDRYTTLAAEGLVAQGKRITLTKIVLDPPWTFFRTYVLQQGYLDGLEGIAIAYMAAFYNFVKYAKACYMRPGRDN